MAAKDGVGERRRTRSLDERKRIVEEALAPGVSVAAVARRHGLNANLIFKWIRRSREGWRDRRREPAKEKPVVAAPPERGGSAFVPVKLLSWTRPQRRRLPMS
jgi:transposase